jgi:uncharacterized protein YkwD
LAQIAVAHDTTVARLVELNKEAHPSLATDPGVIEIGWKLKVPGSSAGIQVTVRKTPSLGFSSTATTMDRIVFEMEVVRLVNEERIKAGLALLEVDSDLMQLARERSEDMVKRGYMGHNDPATGQYLGGNNWENATQLLRTTNLTPENTRRAVSNWIKSPGHKHNILLTNTKRTGVGIAIGSSFVIVTQVFAE